MASKQTYECYVCKRNGFPNVRVYLDGKTEDGRTIYKNEDMSPHAHKLKQQAQFHQEQQVSNADLTELLKVLNEKMDRIIALLDSQNQSKKEMS
jgi:hypothetical protein